MEYKVQNHKRRFLVTFAGCTLFTQIYFLPNAIFNLALEPADNGTRWRVVEVLRLNEQRYPILKVLLIIWAEILRRGSTHGNFYRSTTRR